MPGPGRPKKLRNDPSIRPVDGVAPFFAVRNRDPERKYVFVPKSATEHGVDHYHYLGYEVETYREGGPFLAMGPKNKDKLNGLEIESRGQILMSISKEDADRIDQFGADGTSGQNAADEQQKRMLNAPGRMVDLMRGIDYRANNGDKAMYLEAEKGSFMSSVSGDDHG